MAYAPWVSEKVISKVSGINNIIVHFLRRKEQVISGVSNKEREKKTKTEFFKKCFQNANNITLNCSKVKKKGFVD